MNKTVAIIGSHPRTRDQFDFNRTDCSIWVFNEAMKYDWCKRATGVFQMHSPTVFRSITNRNDPNHYEWLQNAEDITIFMQDVYDDVPSSERYPLEGVLALTPGYSYLTSSVAEAIALAIYKGYERIEIYGAEMETGTEYGNQRQGVAFWIGVAVGKGIDVQHYSSTFWAAPLYGYEGDSRIDMEHYRERIVALSEARDKAQQNHTLMGEQIAAILKAFIQNYKADQSQLDDLIVKAGQTGHDFGVFDGALQVNEGYLKRCEIMESETGDYIIVRQELEGKAYAGAKEKEQALHSMHVWGDRLGEARKKLRTIAPQAVREKLVGDFTSKFSDFIKAATKAGISAGILQENINLMRIHDNLTRAQGIEEPQPGPEPAAELELSMSEDIEVMEAELDAIEAIN